MKRTNLILAASLAVFATVFASCEKDDSTTDPMVETSQDDDMVSSLYDDVQNEADEISLSGGGAMKASADYTLYSSGTGSRNVETTYDGDWTIKTITFVNFVNGNSGNGRVKNGQIIIRILGGPLQAQFERIVTFNNFTIDDVKIEGEKHITKTAEYQYTVQLTGGKVTFTDGKTYTRECNRVRTWQEGFNTPAYIWDDTYTITGTSTGVNRKGYAYTHTITSPLVIKNTCRWIVEGTIEMVVNDNTAIFDYGDGTCDNLATVTVNGVTKEVTLRGKR